MAVNTDSGLAVDDPCPQCCRIYPPPFQPSVYNNNNNNNEKQKIDKEEEGEGEEEGLF